MDEGSISWELSASGVLHLYGQIPMCKNLIGWAGTSHSFPGKADDGAMLLRLPVLTVLVSEEPNYTQEGHLQGEEVKTLSIYHRVLSPCGLW